MTDAWWSAEMGQSDQNAEVLSQVRRAITAIRARHTVTPRIGLILGSGLGSYADTFSEKTVIPYHQLPHFPKAGVPGHPGNLILGEAEGITAVALQGRVHRYEGYTMAEVAFPVRVLGALGIRQLIVTNAAGGLDPEFKPGDLMLITDHINLMGGNPLIGRNIEEFGPRFPDMSEAYDPAMREVVLRTAAERGVALREGVYAGLTGPAYETPAEIRMCRILGADAVGMSTVPEVMVASHMGIHVLGISCITNMAAGMLARRLSHEEVMETASRVNERFISLLRWTIPLLSRLAGA
jgi:purine-nucleoside phosphorylase